MSQWSLLFSSPPVPHKGETMAKERSAGDAAERKQKERKQYLGGLSRYAERGIPVYMDGKLSGEEDWERLFEVREDGMFYMGDYVQAEGGGLKEIRFDRVYLSHDRDKEERGKEKEP